MAFEKIKEVRAKLDSGDLLVTLKLPKGVEEPLHASGFPPERMAAILQVFNTGRTCSWDHDRWEFATAKGDPKSGAAEDGKVIAWEIAVPRQGDIRLFVRVTLGATRKPWFRVPCHESDLPAAISMLTSRFCRAVNGALTNSEHDVS